MPRLPMRRLFLTLTVSLLSCALTLAVLHHLRARQEGALGWFRAQNDQMRYEAYQRSVQAARLSATEAPERKPGAQEADTAGAGQPQDACRPSVTNTGEIYGYHDAGQTRPADTLQTFVWACERGDASKVASLLRFAPGDHEQAERYFSNLPAEQRAHWRNVRELAAHLLILASLANSFPAADVLASAPVSMHGDEQATCGAAQRINVRKENGLWYYELSAARLEGLHREATHALAASGGAQGQSQ